MQRSDYLDRWSLLHGYDARTNPIVHAWLCMTFALARRLAAARVSPHVLTAGGVVLAAFAAAAAAAGGAWRVGAAALIASTGLLDSLDGAVAVIRNRVSQLGAVLDAGADRAGDLLFVLALWLAGAPAIPCILGAALMSLHEYLRARSRASGRRAAGVITVSERPTRVIVTAMFLLAAGLYDGALWPSLGAWAWVGLGAAGVVQLWVALRRPDESGDDGSGHAH